MKDNNMKKIHDGSQSMYASGQRPWREIMGAQSAERGRRVVPLPLAALALAAPLLAAWAPVQEREMTSAVVQTIHGAHAEARPLDEPFVFLGRDVRIPAEEGGYVDVWAVPQGWEADALRRRRSTLPDSPGR